MFERTSTPYPVVSVLSATAERFRGCVRRRSFGLSCLTSAVFPSLSQAILRLFRYAGFFVLSCRRRLSS